MNDLGFGTNPPAQRTFTTEDIASLTGYSKEGVRNILRYKGYRPQIKPTKTSRQAVWSYDAYKSVMEWASSHIDKAENKSAAKKAETDKTIEQLKAEHPLVTDEKCFKLSWWPDTTPECFKELD